MIPLVGQELSHIQQLRVSGSSIPMSFSRVASPYENSLMCSFMFALYSPYRTKMLNNKTVNRKEVVRTAMKEMRTRYPSKNSRIAEMIATTCDYFSVNAAVYETNFTTLTIYSPYNGLSDKTIIISRIELEGTDESHYELIAAEMKGIMRLVFGTEETLIQRMIGE